MATTRCTTCGLVRQDCQCPRQSADQPYDFTPSCWCACYFCFTIILFFVPFFISGKVVREKGFCYLELYANSISNTNTNMSTTDWRINLIAKSPVTRCKYKLHTIKSRLLRGDKVISDLPILLDGFGQLVTSEKSDKPVINVDFKNVVTPLVIGSVVWDYKVEFVFGMKSDVGRDGFLLVVCGDIPVKFTMEPAGKVVGSLLGNMRRCDYVYHSKLIKGSDD